MKSEVVRISADILEFLGHPKNINNALRLTLGVPAKVKEKPPLKKKRVNFDEIGIRDVKTFPRSEYKWFTVERAVYRKNENQVKFAFSYDAKNTYVTRLR